MNCETCGNTISKNYSNTNKALCKNCYEAANAEKMSTHNDLSRPNSGLKSNSKSDKNNGNNLSIKIEKDSGEWKGEVSDLPAMWIAFAYVAASLLAVIPMGNIYLTSLVSSCAMIYWLFCIHRFHKILGELSITKYPISPGTAVGFHFIPFYSLYWIFKWPIEFAKFINAQGIVKTASGVTVGLLILISLVLNQFFFIAPIGLACLFGIVIYLVSKLRKQIEHSRAYSPKTSQPTLTHYIFIGILLGVLAGAKFGESIFRFPCPYRAT